MAQPLAAVGDEFQCCAVCAARARYLRDIADLLGLRDWTVEAEHEPCPPDHLCEVRIPHERRELHVSFCSDFDELEAVEQRHAIVHELVHPHLSGIWSAVEDGAREAFGGMAYRVYAASVRREVERSTDALAAVVAAYLPEPEW